MLNMITMAVREIKLFPDPVLRSKTARVERIDGSLDLLIEDMVETMHAAPGVGLAANQVGVSLQVAVIDLSARENEEQRHPLIVLINPELLSMEGSVTEEEGCLSFPEIREKVVRAAKVRIRAQDEYGKWFEMDGEELLSRAFQHEIDHLDGIVFLFRMSALKRNLNLRKIRKMQSEGTW